MKINQTYLFLLQELVHIHKPESILDSLIMEKKLYEVANREWQTMEPIGTSFSPQMQKDVSLFMTCINILHLIFQHLQRRLSCDKFYDDCMPVLL